MAKRKGAFVLFDPTTPASKIVSVLMAHHQKIAADHSVTVQPTNQNKEAHTTTTNKAAEKKFKVGKNANE